MVSDKSVLIKLERARRVLILVLMEYGLWRIQHRLYGGGVMGLNPCSNGIWSLTRYYSWSTSGRWVLILVLMEYGLWHLGENGEIIVDGVLILVLMEYGLWHLPLKNAPPKDKCLNPCSNGIWSLTRNEVWDEEGLYRLNPCSNGIWSLTLG